MGIFFKDKKSERYYKRKAEIEQQYNDRMNRIKAKSEKRKAEYKETSLKINKEIKENLKGMSDTIKDTKIEIGAITAPGILKVRVGIRKPSLKKMIKARTTAKAKRKLSTINPLYGQKGMGWVNNPKRALYNKTYHKTTKSIFKIK